MTTDAELFALVEANPTDQQLFDVGLVTEDYVADQVERYLTLKEEEARLKEQYQARLDRKKREIAHFEEMHLHVLEAWMEAQPKKGKARYVDLPTGRLQKKAVAGGPNIVDKEALTVWAQAEFPSAVQEKTVYELDTEAIRKRVTGPDQVIPGVEWRPARDSFLIQAPKGAKED